MAGNGGKGNGRDLSAAQIAEWPVQPYQLLAAGHVFHQAQSDIMLVQYDDYRIAETDFPYRRDLLTKGQSFLRKMPYSQQFILEDAVLDDALLTYILSPSPTLPSRPACPRQYSAGCWIRSQTPLFAVCRLDKFAEVGEVK